MDQDKNIVYGPLTLPSGRLIKFRAPKGIDRMNILQMNKIDEENVVSGAMLLDEYIKAKCIVEVNGSPVNESYKALMNEWLDTDIAFYKMVFEQMFGKTEELQAKAKEAAAFLLKGLTSSDGHNAQGTPESATPNG